MKHLQQSVLDSTQHRNDQRMYICTWYRKQYPENVVTSYETAKNAAEIKGRMRRSGRILVSMKRDTTYEYNSY